ncbi:MAG: glycosyltransferase [Bacteroidales bacterium]
MNQDTIDIILPTYKPNINFLERAIQSILNQQYTNWILYLVQDGNDCDVLCLVNSFNDNRIKYFEIAHCGKAAALNYALEQGSSKYIAYQDDDDIWYPNHLMTCIDYMQTIDTKFVHTDAYEVFISITKEKELFETSRRSLHKGLLSDLTLYYISHINVVHERELIRLAGIYDKSLQFFIDWDMFQRFALHSKPNHLPVYTCEHYIYTNEDGININTISSIHRKNQSLHEEKTIIMFKKSFILLSPDNYVNLLEDWQNKYYSINDYEQQIQNLIEQLSKKDKEQFQKNEELNQKNEELIQKKEELKQKNDELFQKNNELLHKDKELKQIVSSKSWIITKPLRFIFNLFK